MDAPPPQPQQQQTSTNTNNQHLSNNQDENRGKTIFVKVKAKILPGVRITLLLSLIIYFAMLVVGCLGIHKCPAEKYVPLFLIATGAIGLLSKLISYMKENLSNHVEIRYMESSLYTVETVFLIFGSYWVFRIYKPIYDNTSDPRYCQKTLYMFAFVYLTVLYAIAIAMLAGFVFFLICICFLKKVESDNSRDPEAPTETTQIAQNVESGTDTAR